MMASIPGLAAAGSRLGADLSRDPGAPAATSATSTAREVSEGIGKLMRAFVWSHERTRIPEVVAALEHTQEMRRVAGSPSAGAGERPLGASCRARACAVCQPPGMRAAALFALSIASCDSGWFGPSHDEIERVRLDDGSTIEVRLRVSPTLLDDTAEVRVMLLREGSEPLPVLEDQAEAQGLRGETLATRLSPGDAIGVHLRVTLCVLPVGAPSFECFSLADHAPHSELSEDVLHGLEWVSGEPRAGERQRVRAACALASARAVDPSRALRVIDAAIDVAERAQDHEGSLELRALRHGRTPAEPSLRELSTAVREGSWADALSVARGCAKSLEAPLEERLRDSPASVQREYDAIRARCRRPP